jgi:heme o synthase
MKSNIRIRLFNYLKISKLNIMIPVSLTGFTGYFIYKPILTPSLFLTSLGILLLAVAASVMNQIQEVDLDKKMLRTQNRPIPTGRISVRFALLFFFLNLISGTFILLMAGNLKASVIGLITIFWYNGIYTLLKRITAFAVIPGAVTGALPPLIGWVAAGGSIWDMQIIFIEFLFFTGQIPHFWLLILKHGEEYKNAGIPNLTDIFNSVQINRLTFIWSVSSVIAALFLCYFEIITSLTLVVILVLASLFIVWKFIDLIRFQPEKKGYHKYSVLLYFYFLLIIILLITDKVIT